MTVNKLDENRVLIILEKKELNDLSLSVENLSLDNIRDRRVLFGLTRMAFRKTGIRVYDEKINIEALSFETECYLLITVGGIKRAEAESLCFSLGSAGNMLDTVEQLYRLNICLTRNSVYELGGDYYLVFDYPSIPLSLRRVLSEYGCKKRLSTEVVREHGRKICETNAVAVIGGCLV